VKINLSSLNLAEAERRLAVAALRVAKTITGAAALLEVRTSRLKHIIVIHHIPWPPLKGKKR